MHIRSDNRFPLCNRVLRAAAAVAAFLVCPAEAVYPQAEAPPPARTSAAEPLPAVRDDAEPELLTDRPDFTETSVVVPRGLLQIEGGFTYERDKTGQRALSLPESLLRLGVGSRWEGRLELPGYTRLRGSERQEGSTDLAVGAKYQLRPTDARVQMALIPMFSLPTGERGLSSGRVDPSLAWAWATDLSPNRSVAGLIGAAWPTEDGDRRFTVTATLSFGFALTPRSDAFLEAFAEFPEGGPHLPGLHTGVTYRLRPNLQFDLHGGVGLSGSGTDTFLGAGFAVRH